MRDFCCLITAAWVLLVVVVSAQRPLTDQYAIPTANGYAGTGRKRILSFGGTGMVGSEVLTRLLATNQYDIVLVCRGLDYFDSFERVKSKVVRFIKLDREDGGLASNEMLLAEIQATPEYFAVLDFSGFEPDMVRESVGALRNKARLYIYMSCANVYEVSPDAHHKKQRRVVETDAKRPPEREARRQRPRPTQDDDDYNDDPTRNEEEEEWQDDDFTWDHVADESLQAEEYLVDQRAGKYRGFPYVIFRLAELMGPRELRGSFVHYMTWIKYQHILAQEGPTASIHVPDDVIETSSVTYPEDVAQVVLHVLDKPETWDEAYNIACEEVFNLTSFITEMSVHIKGEDHPGGHGVEKLDAGLAIRPMFQSFTIGPFDISKAKERLGFAPTPLAQVMKRTIDWYESSFWLDDHPEQAWMNGNQETKKGFLVTFIEDWAHELFWDEHKSDDEMNRQIGEVLGHLGLEPSLSYEMEGDDRLEDDEEL